MNRKQGTIKMFNESKGYGFITPENSDKDVFFHINGFDASVTEITENEKVEFDVEKTKKGLQAINITKV